jgi:RNA recognition motif. (a.k.a. RRM, RBD, or RNP domain)
MPLGTQWRHRAHRFASHLLSPLHSSPLNTPLFPLQGNLPNKITRDEVLKSIVGKLGKGVVTDLRLSLDENKRPRGFGYVELKEESMVEGAIADLNGLDVGECHGTLFYSTLHSCALLLSCVMCHGFLVFRPRGPWTCIQQLLFPPPWLCRG